VEAFGFEVASWHTLLLYSFAWMLSPPPSLQHTLLHLSFASMLSPHPSLRHTLLFYSFG
jgi:hypothetical protein